MKMDALARNALHAIDAPRDQSRRARPMSTNDDLLQMQHILHRKALRTHFQPILDLRKREYIGYEALTRGPVDTPWHMPAQLFALAQRCQMQATLENACRKTAMATFSTQQRKGKLFINLSPNMLLEQSCADGILRLTREEHNLAPDQIVIEITENQKISDFEAFREALGRYRQHGYSFAIDDLGEGFSNLRMWSEIRPEFVKIDRHFVSGIDQDTLKFKLVKAMSEIAEACHATLIAEGIETSGEFITLRDLGIACGQGYFIARPAPEPPPTPQENIIDLLDRGTIAVFPQTATQSRGQSIAALTRSVVAASPSDDNESIYARFEENEQLYAIPVIDALARPIGMLNRHRLIERFARPYQRELYARKPCTHFMDRFPLVCDKTTPIHQVGKLLGEGQRQHLHDGVIVTDNGSYLGIAESGDVMSRITEMQIHSARYANPLTQLPGNVPINEHITRLLDAQQNFVACHVDIDHFKPYNDIYGYRRGDDVIQFLGRLLLECSDQRLDFTGHIGGDDFVVLFQSADWHTRCKTLLERFDREILGFIDHADLQRGHFVAEDRRGVLTHHTFPSLSIGSVVATQPGYPNHNALSAAMATAKKEAKKQPGSCLFIERRKGPTCHEVAT